MSNGNDLFGTPQLDLNFGPVQQRNQQTQGITGMLNGVGNALSAVPVIGQAVGGLVQAGEYLFSLLSNKNPGTPPAVKNLQRTKPGLSQYFQQQFYNPAFQDRFAPGFLESSILGQLDPGETIQQKYGYNYTPIASTKAIYDMYLQRQYGIPQQLARSISSQAMAPLKAQDLPGQPFTSAQARGAFQTDPNQLAQARLGQQAPESLRQMDYLQNAARLAGYNLWKTQQLPQLIG